MTSWFSSTNAVSSCQPVEQKQPLIDLSGMKVLTASKAIAEYQNMRITGEDNQLLTVTLAQGEQILVQPGCMMWCDEGIKTEVTTGGLSNMLTRAFCMDASMFRVHWKNTSPKNQTIGLTSPEPTKIIPVNLNAHSGELFVTGGAFMAATDPNLEFTVTRAGRGQGSTFSKGAFAGQGFFLTKIKGQGFVFVCGHGTVLEKSLAAGEKIVVDQMAVLAWEASIEFGFRMAGGASMLCCGGEGLTNTTLTGPGYVLLQSVTTPAEQQANPVATIVAMVWCCLFCMMIFLGPIMGALGAVEEEQAIANNSTIPVVGFFG